MIYFSMIVPIITSVILYVYWRHKSCWWEILIPFCVSLVLCCVMKFTTEVIQTSDVEWWISAIVSAEYYEAWNETVPCRHLKRDNKGNITGYEHIFDVDYHPPYWQVTNSNGTILQVDYNKFEELSRKFGNKQFVNMYRCYHSINGNKYVTKWNGDENCCEVCTTKHHYKNKIIASNSVFKFPEPDSKENLFEYPPITEFYKSRFILGLEDKAAEHKLAIWNAYNGKEKQCRLIFLIYNDLPIDVALNQENYWQGGNKNEFIVSIGVSRSKIDWCHIISWTEAELLKAEVKNYVSAQEKLNLNELVDVIGEKVKSGFVRKQFKDFDYLTVEPPFWTVGLTFFLTIGVNVGLSIWIIRNESEKYGIH